MLRKQRIFLGHGHAFPRGSNLEEHATFTDFLGGTGHQAHGNVGEISSNLYSHFSPHCTGLSAPLASLLCEKSSDWEQRFASSWILSCSSPQNS